MKRGATISSDGVYRFDLTREVQIGCTCKRCVQFAAAQKAGAPLRDGHMVFVLCNPSKADAETDDATERRVWAYSIAWGFPKFVLVNTNPFRSTDPRYAKAPDKAAALENQLAVHFYTRDAALIICAWGGNASRLAAMHTINTLKATGRPVYVLELSQTGTPKHPLYLSGKLTPKPWSV